MNMHIWKCNCKSYSVSFICQIEKLWKFIFLAGLILFMLLDSSIQHFILSNQFKSHLKMPKKDSDLALDVRSSYSFRRRSNTVSNDGEGNIETFWQKLRRDLNQTQFFIEHWQAFQCCKSFFDCLCPEYKLHSDKQLQEFVYLEKDSAARWFCRV